MEEGGDRKSDVYDEFDTSDQDDHVLGVCAMCGKHDSTDDSAPYLVIAYIAIDGEQICADCYDDLDDVIR